MIVDNNITSYIYSLESVNDEKTESLRLKSESEDVPIIRREMESFLRVLLMMKKPLNILEIGTAVGYSSIFMANVLKDSSVYITTIENYEKRIAKAHKNIADFGLDNTITLLEGDAVDILGSLSGTYDFIFLDAAKAQYITMLPDLLRLMPEGGILLADNILQDGELIKSRFVTPRRQRTIHERLRQFIWEIKHSKYLETTLITIGDGVTLSIRNNVEIK